MEAEFNNQKPGTPASATTDTAKPDGLQPGEAGGNEIDWDAIKQSKEFQKIVAGYRQKAKEAEKQLAAVAKEREDAERAKLEEQKKYAELYEKSEAERKELLEKLTALENARIADKKRSALLDAARKHNPPFRSLADVEDYIAAHNLLDDVEIDESGNVSGAEDIIRAIASERSHWLKTERSDPGVPGYKPNGNKSTADKEALARRFGIY